jgi:hypothetical protein
MSGAIEQGHALGSSALVGSVWSIALSAGLPVSLQASKALGRTPHA